MEMGGMVSGLVSQFVSWGGGDQDLFVGLVILTEVGVTSSYTKHDSDWATQGSYSAVPLWLLQVE